MDVVREADPRYNELFPQGFPDLQRSLGGHRYRDGLTLEMLRERLGGDEGYLSHPDAGRFFVSLYEWKNEPSTTRFFPRFRFIADDPEQFRHALGKIRKHDQ